MNQSLTNASTSSSPSSWLSLAPPSPDSISTWPWLHLKINQWLNMLQTIYRLQAYTAAIYMTIYTLYAVGILGNLLTLFTIFSKKELLRNAFYICLITISLLDIIF